MKTIVNDTAGLYALLQARGPIVGIPEVAALLDVSRQRAWSILQMPRFSRVVVFGKPYFLAYELADYLLERLEADVDNRQLAALHGFCECQGKAEA